MKVIINCRPEWIPEAYGLAQREINEGIERYDRPGWGWTFGRFWVRGIKGGISVSERKDTQ